MLLTDGLQYRLARVGRQPFIQTLLHVGGFGVGIDALGRAGGDAHQRRVGDVSRFPAGCLHAPDATDEQKRQHRGQAKHTLGAAGFCGIVPAIRMAHQRQHTADGGPCQVHKSRGQSKQRREIADKESCVIVGRNADYILREFDHCLRVFVHADRNWRLLHMRKLMPDTPFDQLEVDMDKADRARKNYCVKHTGRVYGDSRNYDLTLCTSKLGIDKALEILLCAAKDI